MSSAHSTSRTSVYEYPEHLNPFYEDEQHKRLRFWKISNSTGKPRRLSFNLGSIKNLLPFESFRLKKKSSTLGVNKTSESPSSPRKFDNHNSFANYDSRLQRQGSIDFQRNTPYRSSLQTLNDFSFTNRNNRYRSTIQGSAPYKNNETPRSLSSRAHYLSSSTNMTPGSSMNSVNTNPFEDNENEFTISSSISDSKGHNDRKKKKRRAPLPPALSPETMRDINGNDEAVTIRENDTKYEDVEKGLQELSRMTAEFESFVKHSNETFQNGSNKLLHEDVRIEHNLDDKNQKNQNDDKGKESKIFEREIIVNQDEDRSSPTANNRVRDKEENSSIANIEVNVVSTKVRQFPEIDQISSSTSREETPDYIPVPVREKFQPLEIIESKHVSQNENLHQKETKAEAHVDEKKNCENVEKDSSEKINENLISTAKMPNRSQSAETETIVASTRNIHEPPQTNEIETNSKSSMYVQEHPASVETVIIVTSTTNIKDQPTIVETETITSTTNIQKYPQNVEAETIFKPTTDIQNHSPNIETETIIKSTTKPIVPKKPALPPRKYFFREETPVPLARTEIETKLSSQGFVKVNEQDVKKDAEEDEVVIREKEEIIDTDHPAKPPRNRRSVKEIIESINRNQLLLKVNQPSTPTAERKIRYISNDVTLLEKPVIKVREGAFIDPRINNYTTDNQVSNNSSSSLHEISKN
ncbi:CLUMA_CG002501, isoform A [Clunio marinus]|uniref:CLUMA_CG002501, isoform A n=1 Tax=Clunio marinus TaxID=568069 RepID=A0A1J1HRH5_9DIPT|nr:CLUMA_CG002501, isoform A [Clunio marinus]